MLERMLIFVTKFTAKDIFLGSTSKFRTKVCSNKREQVTSDYLIALPEILFDTLFSNS